MKKEVESKGGFIVLLKIMMGHSTKDYTYPFP